jgi:hypothetical protein
LTLFGRIVFGLAAFLIVAGLIYAVTSQEYLGAMLFVLCAAGFAFIGLFVRHSVRESATATDGEANHEEPHIRPTIWPFVLSLGGLGLVLGAAVASWLAVAGAAVIVLAGIGWFVDVTRQWSHDRSE